jgi:hypothetical protein
MNSCLVSAIAVDAIDPSMLRGRRFVSRDELVISLII